MIKKLLIVLMVLFCQNCSYAFWWLFAPQEVKGMWVTRFQMNSKSDIEQFVSDAKKYGINNIFVQVRGRGESYYESDIEKMAPEVNRGFDPLGYTIELAHKNGIKIHAWINMYFVWSKLKLPESAYHVVNSHPEWFIDYINSSPDTIPVKRKDYFLDPSDINVKKYLNNICMEVVNKYNIDGLHLDYIRYPNEYCGFSKSLVNKYKSMYGVDPVSLFNQKDKLIEFYGDTGYQKLFSKWAEMRSNEITGLVKEIKDEIAARKPNVQLSAAVYPEFEKAKGIKGQDWKLWLENGCIDFAVPMTYRLDTKQVEKELAEAVKINTDKFILAGLGVYLISPEAMSDQINLIRKIEHSNGKLKGWVLFSYDFMKKDSRYLEVIK